MKKALFCMFYFLCIYGFAQDNKSGKNDRIYKYEEYVIFEGDTVVFELDEVRVLNKIKFVNDYDRRYYYWFRKKTMNAYPFAKLASERLTDLNRALDSLKSKRKKKIYTKKVQKYMEEEFTDQLKKLTRTEGRILIKLIHRQTGITTFDLVREIRSGWKAFWYHKTARFFKLSLKLEYNPSQVNEDFMIEDVLQRAFIDGRLEKQDSKLDFNYVKIATDKGNLIHIEKKK
jgi:hypothetical protein